MPTLFGRSLVIGGGGGSLGTQHGATQESNQGTQGNEEMLLLLFHLGCGGLD
jgi:hypothetical protein